MHRLILILLLGFMLSCQNKEKADLIITNAKIYSVNGNFDVFNAMAIADGKILKVADEKEILSEYKSENLKDLNGKTVYPGFYDAHAHFFGYANVLQKANLKGSESFDEIILRVITHRTKYPNSEWILGRGWDQNLWEIKEFPNKAVLDSIFPNTPVLLTRVDGHAALVNQKALDLAGFDANTVIEGGKLIKDENGLTGILLDNAETEINSLVPLEKRDVRVLSYLEAQRNCLKVGLTSLVDCGIKMEWFEISDSLYQSGDFKIKLNLLLNPEEENFAFAKENGVFKSDRLQVQGFKVYSDGALGSRGACLLEPYSDDPENSGFLLSSPENLKAFAKDIYDLGYQMNTHAIGDSANRLMLDIYNEILGNDTVRRWRIEHAQVLDPADFQKFKKNKIIPSVQATHCTSDMYWADERLGEDRINYAYAYKTLLDNAGILALGSDFPVEDINPIYGFHAAVARVDSENKPEGGFQMKDAISRENALRGMTIWAAYSVFEDNRKGSLEPGKDADFVVLDRDIMEVGEEKLRGTKVLYIYISGLKEFDLEQ